MHNCDLFGRYIFDEVDENEDEFAVAISEKVIICSFRMNDFENIMKANLQLRIRYTKLVGFRIKKMTNKYTNLMFKDVKPVIIIIIIERLGIKRRKWKR